MLTMSLGIDISKDKLDVALYQTGRYKTGSFSNDKDGWRRLAKWLKKQKAKGVHVCLEATGRYGEGVAMYLDKCGYAVSVVNPARIKAYGQSQLQRNKTDQQDAKVIAHFCATQNPSLWAPPSPEVQELQALSRRLETLKADRTRELNRQQSGLTSETVLTNIAAHIAFLNDQIAEIEQQMRDLIDQDPDLGQQHELLTSIPGIGDITAANFMAEVPDVTRFESAGQLAAYAGLSPRKHHSGSSIHRPGRLVKIGNRRFRAVMYMPALSAMRHNPIVQALVARLTAKGKSRMTIVGAAMRKLVHLAFGVLKHRRPFDPNYLVNLQGTT
ncbi:IS110 family transposase [Candidatus Leptofilum sp.]|uniref:IS110 family transposase n=1 Tax=Candidatus Leptofilum sp. TaxID=3241576 RepID=UPI003B5A4107